jgi:hypothetical protein
MNFLNFFLSADRQLLLRNRKGPQAIGTGNDNGLPKIVVDESAVNRL